jgi:glycosyltransferase involved in cell wall biosynthesis
MQPNVVEQAHAKPRSSAQFSDTRNAKLMTPVVHVATCGKASDVTFFGGAPYFLVEGLKRAGVRAAAHDLKQTHDFRWRGFIWRAREFAASRGLRGYMFSNDFLERAWADAPQIRPGDWIVNLFQLFPESILKRAEQGEISLVPYVDLSLHELFREWGPASGAAGKVSDIHYENAVARERRGYIAARKVVTFSRRSAEVLKARYRLDARKITTVTPGANVDEDLVDAVLQNRPGSRERKKDFVVGYVGVDHHRKGLPKLVAAVLAARQAGAPVVLRVIGPRPRDFENTPGIELIGSVSKLTEMRRFIELIGDCQLGCLLSSAEGLPISLLEFLRVGVPIVGTKVNGIPDIVAPEVGILVDPDAPVAEIAALLVRLAKPGSDYAPLRAAAWEARLKASWRRAAEELRSMLSTPGSGLTGS